MFDRAYRELTSSQNKLFVIVAGNIGSGKTTLTRKLSKRLNWKPYYESVTDNPYLEDFYLDMSRWAFPLQVYFLNHRFKVHRTIESSSFSAIQDRSIYEDAHIFARALYEQNQMSKRDYDNYSKLYEAMVGYLGAPTILIFLRRSLEKLQERIKKRGREFELSISVDYLTRLNQYYDDWFEGYNAGKTLLVQTDDLDFLENEDHFNKLVVKIQDSLGQQELFCQY